MKSREFLGPPPSPNADARVEDAIAATVRKLETQPNDVQALVDLGRLYQRQSEFARAAASFARAVALRPSSALIHNDLGTALCRLSRLKEAEVCFRRAMGLRPDFVEAINNLGNVARMKGRLSEAEEWHRRALAAEPDFADAFFHLGVTLREQGRLAEAMKCHRQALAIKPDFVDALVHLGAALREAGRLAEAMAYHRQALVLAPDNLDAQLNLAFAQLTLGDLPAGSAAYECRFGAGANRQYPVADKPLWDGKPLTGRTLMLWGELGFGDTIQFVRYAKLVRPMVGCLILRCHPALHRLMETAPGLDEVSPITAPLPSFDTFIPVLSLMRVFGTTLETIPASVPYLAADPGRVAAFSPRLGGPGRRIGIVWAGNPRHGNDRRRSLPLAALGPIFDVPNTRFFSLQTDAFIGQPNTRAAELRGSPWASHIVDLAADLRDFADTAAALSALDLLISVDTSVVHLAGALDRPAWVLLPFNADWRWLLARSDSPWYPSLRLYRQDETFDWAPAIERLRRNLAAFAAGA